MKKHGVYKVDKLYKDKDWLYDQYWNKKKTLEEIGELCGVHKRTILYWMKKFNIERRTKSETLIGKKFTTEHKRKISESLNGKIVSKESIDKMIKNRRDYSGKNNPNWNNLKNDPSYQTIHFYVRRNKQKPNKCEECGGEKRLCLSFDHSLGDYTRNIKDYKYLCYKCHSKRDA